MNNLSILTKSALVIRKDISFGDFIFSPYTGLIFASNTAFSKELISWLQKIPRSAPPTTAHLKALGPGWAIPLQEAEYPPQHLLPDSKNWNIPNAKFPIIINWLLTGICAFDCGYCYAEDLMRGACSEPDELIVQRICKTILSYSPIAIVLTGGDPLLSPHLELALNLLAGKTGLIIDTSGYALTPKLIKLFKRFGVFVRISLDSELPRINDDLRPFLNKKAELKNDKASQIALKAICQLSDAGVPVSVQTVATKYNRSDLEPLGDKLFRIGVRAWRILMVAPSSKSITYYDTLRGTESGQNRFNKFIEQQIRTRHENGWNKGMGVQITHNREPNSVILVSPEGLFFTESPLEPGKVLIDPKNPKLPRLSLIHEKVDFSAHIKRYLSL